MAEFSRTQDDRLRKPAAFVLASFWFAGILGGMLLASRMEADFLFRMRSALWGPVSVVGLLGSALAPFLLSALAVSISMPLLLYPICFCKALAFSFAASCVLRAFGSCGWLAGVFVLFSDGVGIPVLYAFWQHQLVHRVPLSTAGAAPLALLLVLAAGFHARIVSPFWVSLLF